MAAPNGTLAKYGDRVSDLHKKGLSPTEITHEIGGGVTYGQVSNMIKLLRKKGVIEPPGYMVGLPRGFPIGSMARMVRSLDQEQRRWLYDEAIKYGCNSAEEIILEIVRDAHAEAQC